MLQPQACSIASLCSGRDAGALWLMSNLNTIVGKVNCASEHHAANPFSLIDASRFLSCNFPAAARTLSHVRY